MTELDDDARIAALPQRLGTARERIAAAASAAGRHPDEVRLLLATKRMPATIVRAAVDAGADLLGENTVQELITTAAAVHERPRAPELHLIGHLQSNKVNHALRVATCVQSVDTTVIAGRLSRRCATVDRDLDVMVQVNVSGEDSKHGVSPKDAVALATHVAGLDRLRLVGLMTIGAHTDDEDVVRSGYALLRELREEVLASGAPGTDTTTELSMGMSRDLELAVAEGATMVRVGTAVLGERPTGT